MVHDMNILNALVQSRDDIKTWVTNNLNALNTKIDEKTIPIDSELSSTSTNPVQNKVIKKAIDNIPTFSGDYNDLINAPDISEDDSGNMIIADESGNIIFKADADGIHTTAVSLNGEAAASEKYVDEAIANINIPEVDFTGYATETYVDNKVADLVNSAPEALNTLGELAVALENHEDAYDALLEIVGSKATHTDLESLKEELSESITAEAEDWKVVDSNGNIILTVNTNGLETTTINAHAININGVDVGNQLMDLIALTNDEIDAICSITEEERLEGDGQEFYTMAPSTLSFRSTAPLNEFQDVQINGEAVDPSNYELEEGSTIVKLKHDYLSMLDIGKYELSVVSDSKTVKGDFTVVAPELNEYGFYYNQPYYINGSIVGSSENFVMLTGAFIVSMNNTVQILDLEACALHEQAFTHENNVYTFDFAGATLTGSFASNGASFITSNIFVSGGGWMPDYSGTDQVEFKIDTEAICSDSEYIYYIPTALNGLIAHPINKNSYNFLRLNINGNPVTGFAPAAFAHTNFISFAIPKGITNIHVNTFLGCANLTSVVIPDSITHIGGSAFDGCKNLIHINFEGTIEQWNAITKGIYWNRNVSATYVQCSDGQIELN